MGEGWNLWQHFSQKIQGRRGGREKRDLLEWGMDGGGGFGEAGIWASPKLAGVL